jgi:deazaflavin-dependent oxidoreductase (nitroreductase family)
MTTNESNALDATERRDHSSERSESTALAKSEELSMTTTSRYLEPGWFTHQVFNRTVRRLTRWGISVAGSRELRVRGRASGEWRSTPVNLLEHQGGRYLVAPRGVTQWVRNIRVSGGGELRVGRRTEPFVVTELANDEKLPVLREYLRRWAWEVGAFFDGIDKDSTDAQLAAVADGFPVFRVTTAERWS